MIFLPIEEVKKVTPDCINGLFLITVKESKNQQKLRVTSYHGKQLPERSIRGKNEPLLKNDPEGPEIILARAQAWSMSEISV